MRTAAEPTTGPAVGSSRDTAAFAEWLREWRASRKLSLSGAAAQAGLSRSTLLRWETGAHLPRLPELDLLLSSLEATPQQRETALSLLGAPRAARALLEETGLPEDIDLPPTGGGVLLRAMRERRGLTQEQLAAHLGVAKTTVSRWERSEAAVPPERLDDLLGRLGAHPRERDALAGGLLRPLPSPLSSIDPPDADAINGDLRGLETSAKVRPQDPLMDLRFLALQSRLRPHLRRGPSIRSQYALSCADYASYLLSWGRYAEAARYAERALEMGRANGPPEAWWMWAVETMARAAAGSERRPSPQRAVEILDLWRDLPGAVDPRFGRDLGVYLQRHQGLYLCRCGHLEAAMEAVRGAVRAAARAEPGELHGSRVFEGRVLLRAGRPGEAIEALPLPRVLGRETIAPAEVIEEELLRAEVLLAVGERSEGWDWMARSRRLLDIYELTPLQRQWDRLADRYNEPGTASGDMRTV